MEITKPNKRTNLDQNSRLNKKYLQFKELVNELRNRELNREIVNTINKEVNAINLLRDSDKTFSNKLKKNQSTILKLIEKEQKIVPKHHYRNIWLALGVGAIGVPIGVIIGLITGSMAFIGTGIPIGFGVGIAIGTMMDQQLKEKGKQLDWEIKY